MTEAYKKKKASAKRKSRPASRGVGFSAKAKKKKLLGVSPPRGGFSVGAKKKALSRKQKPAPKPKPARKPAARPRLTKAEREAEREAAARRESANARRRELRAEAKKAEEKAARKKAARAKKRAALRRNTKRLNAKIAVLETTRQKKRTKQGDKREVERALRRQKKAVRAETKKAFEKTIPAPSAGTTIAEREQIATAKARAHFQKTIAKAKGALPAVSQRLRRVTYANGSHGDEIAVRVNQTVTEESVEDILYRIDVASNKLRGTFPIWLATVFFSAMGEEIVGSPKAFPITQTLDQSYQTLGVINSGVYRARAGMTQAIRHELEELTTPRFRRTNIFCHSCVIRNYAFGPGKP